MYRYTVVAYANASCIYIAFHHEEDSCPQSDTTNIFQFLICILKGLSYFFLLLIYLVSVSLQGFNFQMTKLMTEC